MAQKHTQRQLLLLRETGSPFSFPRPANGGRERPRP
jgi:hypothetical protein